MLAQDFFDDTKDVVRDALASARGGRETGGLDPSVP
jgi:hypothetical protein